MCPFLTALNISQEPHKLLETSAGESTFLPISSPIGIHDTHPFRDQDEMTQQIGS